MLAALLLEPGRIVVNEVAEPELGPQDVRMDVQSAHFLSPSRNSRLMSTDFTEWVSAPTDM